MPKQSSFEEARKKFEAKRSQIRREYEEKRRRLEEKLKETERKRDTGLFDAEKKFRNDSCSTLKVILGEEDYEWLIQKLAKNKETETEEAEQNFEIERIDKLRAMSLEDYLFRYLSDPDVWERLKANIKEGKPEDIERLISIESKLKQENIWLNGTLL